MRGRKVFFHERRRNEEAEPWRYAQKGKKRASIYKKEKLKNLILKAERAVMIIISLNIWESH